MRLTRTLSLLTLLGAVIVSLAGAQVLSDPDRWAQWRSREMDGVARPEAAPPIQWSERENVAWKIELPGEGSSTPVVWGQRIYVQAADIVEDAVRYYVLAFDRETGEELWRQVVRASESVGTIQPNNTWAAASPTVDDRRLYAFFGSQGLYTFTLVGEPVWEQDLGELRTRHEFGEGASAGLYDDVLLVPWDQEDESWLVALDGEDGEEEWRVARDEPTTWYTPAVAEVGDRTHVVTAGTNAVRGYDYDTGELIWHGPGLTLNAIPSPVIVDGIAYLTAGYRGEAMMAIDLARARGDIEETGAILWRYDQDTPYVSSPLVYDGLVYFVKGLQAIWTAVDAETGENVYGPVRIEELSGVYGSPMVAGGHIYLPGRQGDVAVIRPGPEFEIVAVNTLDDGFDASPVAVGPDLYLRGKKHLYKISEAAPPPE